MASFLSQLKSNLTLRNQILVLPEGEEDRTLQAAHELSKTYHIRVILLGDPKVIHERLKKLGLSFSSTVEIIHPEVSESLETIAELFFEKRKHKGISLEQARSIVRNPLFFAAGLVSLDKADACVAGAINTTGDVLRAAIQVIGLKKGSSVVSSVFLMSLPNGKTLTFGDCAVIPYPTSEQLATIAVDSAATHQRLTEETPKVAMLSFSTKGSAKHERVTLVTDALDLVKKQELDVSIDGELQFDAAFVPSIGERKAPNSAVAGKANVFVFPNLDAGNIGYKLTERLANAVATGPIIQGLAKPMMDLSRGCSSEDIVHTSLVALKLSL